jgi:hypothetical protein
MCRQILPALAAQHRGLETLSSLTLSISSKVNSARRRNDQNSTTRLISAGLNPALASRARSRELNLGFVGLAIKRYTELELLFDRIGVDINAAKYAARNLDPNHLPPPAQGGVQEGLFG